MNQRSGWVTESICLATDSWASLFLSLFLRTALSQLKGKVANKASDHRLQWTDRIPISIDRRLTGIHVRQESVNISRRWKRNQQGKCEIFSFFQNIDVSSPNCFFRPFSLLHALRLSSTPSLSTHSFLSPICIFLSFSSLLFFLLSFSSPSVVSPLGQVYFFCWWKCIMRIFTIRFFFPFDST